MRSRCSLRSGDSKQGLALRADVGPRRRKRAGRVVDVDVPGVRERPQAVVARAADLVGLDGRRHVRRRDDVADAEERVVARVVLVEEVLGIGHERRRAQRVPDLVDVLALQVLEDGHRPDQEVVAPVGRRSGVDAAPGVRAHVGQQLVDLRVLLRVRLRPAGRCSSRCGRRRCPCCSRPVEARPPAPRCTARRQCPGPLAATAQPALLLGEQGQRPIEDQAAEEDEGDAGQQDARELHAHLEAADEDVAAAGQDLVEGPERRPPERHDQRDHPYDRPGRGRPRRCASVPCRRRCPTATRIVTTGNQGSQWLLS